jgi:hypothetical protein
LWAFGLKLGGKHFSDDEVRSLYVLKAEKISLIYGKTQEKEREGKHAPKFTYVSRIPIPPIVLLVNSSSLMHAALPILIPRWVPEVIESDVVL